MKLAPTMATRIPQKEDPAIEKRTRQPHTPDARRWYRLQRRGARV